MCEVVVIAAQDPELIKQFFVLGEPVHPRLVDAGGVCDHETVTPVGLGFSGVELGRSTHHQPWHISDRDASAASDRDRERPDRAGLVDHQSGNAVLTGPVQQRLQGGLVVHH